MSRRVEFQDDLLHALALLVPLSLCIGHISARLTTTEPDASAGSMPARPVSARPVPARPVYATPASPSLADEGRCAPSTTGDLPLTCEPKTSAPPWMPDSRSPTPREVLDDGGLAFALVHRTHVILSQAAEPDWSHGPFASAGDDPLDQGYAPHLVARRDADVDALPADIRAALGSRVDVYGAVGKICEATLGEAEVMAAFHGEWPPPGVDISSELLDPYREDLDVPNGIVERARAEVYDTEPRWLLARLELPDGCDGGLFVRSAHLPAPLLWAARPGNVQRAHRDRFLTRADAAMRDHYQAYLRSWEDTFDHTDDVPSWEELRRESYRRRVYRDGGGEARVAFQFTGDAESECGGGFGMYASELRRLRDPDAPPLVEAGVLRRAPLALVDSNGDGTMELLIESHGDGIEWIDPASARSMATERPWFGCGC